MQTVFPDTVYVARDARQVLAVAIATSSGCVSCYLCKVTYHWLPWQRTPETHSTCHYNNEISAAAAAAAVSDAVAYVLVLNDRSEDVNKMSGPDSPQDMQPFVQERLSVEYSAQRWTVH